MNLLDAIAETSDRAVQSICPSKAANPDAPVIPVFHRAIEHNPVEDELWQRYNEAHARNADNAEVLAITLEMLRSDHVRLQVKVLTARAIFRSNPTLENGAATIEALGDAADAEFTGKEPPKLTLV